MRSKDSYGAATIRVRRDGTITADGEAVGYVNRVEGNPGGMGEWRAEIGDAREVESYRVFYAATRKRAVSGAISGE